MVDELPMKLKNKIDLKLNDIKLSNEEMEILKD